jgi:hypothetical protein
MFSGALQKNQEVVGKLAVLPHKKGDFLFGRDFLTQNISQILESLTDFRVDFLFYTDSHRFEYLHICGIFTQVSNR